MALKLVGFQHPHNYRVTKVKLAAALAGIKLEDVGHEVAHTDREAFIRNCSPVGGLPVLQTEQGYLFESSAILRYVARLGKTAGLYGSTDFESSSVDAWLDYVTTELDPAHYPFLLATAGFITLTEAEKKNHTANFCGALVGLDKWLEIRTFLVGERITVADIVVFVAVDTFIRFAPTANEAYKFKHVVRHYMTVLHQPKVQEALKALGHDGLIPAKPKEEKAAAPAKPKEEKPKKEEKAAEAAEEEEPTFEEKKKPNPLDALPPSKFVLDAFKREYSNSDTRTVAAPWFFQNYDPEGYTCFWSTYKYNEENKMQFMTANLVRGWFQRMDHVRKYGFGCVLIIGEEKKHDIVGFWVFRGKGLPEIVREVDDTELFNWIEIADVQAEKDKITDYLCWDGATFANQPVLEGRAFK